MDLNPPPPDDPLALLAASDAARARGAHRPGAEWARQAAALATARGDDALAGDAQALLALHLARLGDVEGAVASGQRALALLGAASGGRPSAALSRVHSTLSNAYERAGLHTLAVSHGASALQQARGSGDLTTECWALNRLGTAANGFVGGAGGAGSVAPFKDRTVAAPGDADRQSGLDLLHQSLALAGQLPDPAERLAATNSAMNNLSRRWVLEADRQTGEAARRALLQALPLAESAVALAAEGLSGFMVATAACNLGGIHRRLGDMPRAERYFRQGMALSRHHGYAALLATAELALASMAAETAPGPATQRALAALLDRTDSVADLDLRLRSRQQLVQDCRATGDLATAVEQLDRLRTDQLAAQALRADLQTRLLFDRTALDQARHAAERARLDAELERLRADAEHRAAEQLALDRDLLEREVAVRTAELQQAKAAAEAANRAKSVFLSIVSHELRNPLNGMLGMLALARRRAADPRQAEQLATADTTGRQLGTLIDHILNYVAADAQAPGDPQPTDLRALAEGLGASRAAAAGAKGLQLVVELPATLPARLVLDGARLRQILDLLLDNAVKFSSAGTVRLQVHWPPSGPAPTHLRLAVADDGPGIDPAQLQRLFRPFELGDPSLNRQHGGLGLGLALARRLAQGLGGDLGVDNHPPTGCSFWVSLPIG